jgi:hypothetical protein
MGPVRLRQAIITMCIMVVMVDVTIVQRMTGCVETVKAIMGNGLLLLLVGVGVTLLICITTIAL